MAKVTDFIARAIGQRGSRSVKHCESLLLFGASCQARPADSVCRGTTLLGGGIERDLLPALYFLVFLRRNRRAGYKGALTDTLSVCAIAYEALAPCSAILGILGALEAVEALKIGPVYAGKGFSTSKQSPATPANEASGVPIQASIDDDDLSVQDIADVL